jgi:hypothetical protein
MTSGRYHASVTTADVWICYPWEAKYVIRYSTRLGSPMLTYTFHRDIDEHDRLAEENPLV